MYLVLASGSEQKRRLAEYLAARVGLGLRVKPVSTDESVLEDPEEMASINAVKKLEAVGAEIAIASDVFPYFRRPFLKPRSPEEARAMMKELSGRWIEIVSATAVKIGEKVITHIDRVPVKIRSLDIAQRLENPNIFKKSGTLTFTDIEVIKGNVYAVMGLNIDFAERVITVYKEGLEFF